MFWESRSWTIDVRVAGLWQAEQPQLEGEKHIYEVLTMKQALLRLAVTMTTHTFAIPFRACRCAKWDCAVWGGQLFHRRNIICSLRNILNILSIYSFSFSLFLFIFSFSWSGVARLKGLMVQGKGLVSHPCPAHSAILTAHSTNLFSFPFSKPVSHETAVWRLFAQFFSSFCACQIILVVAHYEFLKSFAQRSHSLGVSGRSRCGCAHF